VSAFLGRRWHRIAIWQDFSFPFSIQGIYEMLAHSIFLAAFFESWKIVPISGRRVVFFVCEIFFLGKLAPMEIAVGNITQ
jgi:hypothetical protein